MTDAATRPALPFSLDFAWGRGFVSARDVRLTPWARLDHVQLEIPDLRFPVDLAGGIERFRRTRAQARRATAVLDVGGLAAVVSDAGGRAGDWSDVRVELEHDALALTATAPGGARVATRLLLAADPNDTSLVLAADTPVVAGALRSSARLAVADLLRALAGTLQRWSPGVTAERATLRLHPLHLALGGTMLARGWKLPGDETLVNELAITTDGRLRWNGTSPSAPPGAVASDDVSVPYASLTHGGPADMPDADDALFEGDLAGALRRWEEAVARFGDHRELAARRIDALLATGDRGAWARADELATARLARDPGDLTAWQGRARLAALRGDADAELEALEGTIVAIPEPWRAARVVVTTALAGRWIEARPQRARQLLNDVLAMAPREPTALRLRVADARRVGDLAVLADTLRRLASASGDRDEASACWRELAHLSLERGGDLDGARLYLQRARELAPDDPVVRLEAGRLLARAGRAGEAVVELDRAAEGLARDDDPRAAVAHVEAARLWHDALDDAESAAIAWQRALSLRHDDDEVIDGALRALVELRRFDDALRLVDDALARAESRYQGAADDEARRRLARALRRGLHLERARGREEQATELMRRLATLDPTATDATDALTERLHGEGRPDDLAPILRARLAAPLDPDERDATRVALAQVADDDEAHALLRAVGDDAEADGRLEDAAIAWDRALQRRADAELAERRAEILGRLRNPSFDDSRFYVGAREALARARRTLIAGAESVDLPMPARRHVDAPPPPRPEAARPSVEQARRAVLDARDGEDTEALADALAQLADAEPDAFDEAELRIELASLLAWELGRAGDARAHAARAVALDPDGVGADPDVLALLGEDDEAEDDVAATLAAYCEHLDEATDGAGRAVYRLLIAQLLLDERNDADGALAQVDAVLAEDGSHGPARRLRADALHALGRDAESVDELRWIVGHAETDPFERAEVRRELAERLAGALEDAPGALEVLDALLAELPGDSDAIGQYKRISAAAAMWDRAAQVALRELALLTGRLAPFETLREALREVTALPVPMRPTGARVLAEVAATLLAADRAEDALDAARAATALDEDEPAAWEAHAAAAREAGQPDEAAEALRALAELVIDAAEATQLRAEADRLGGTSHDATTRPHPVAAPPRDVSDEGDSGVRPPDVPFAELSPPLDPSDAARVGTLVGASPDDVAAALSTALHPALRRALLLRLGLARLATGAEAREALLPLKGALILDDGAPDTRFALARTHAAAGDARLSREQLDEAARCVAERVPAASSAAAMRAVLAELGPNELEAARGRWADTAPALVDALGGDVRT